MGNRLAYHAQYNLIPFIIRRQIRILYAEHILQIGLHVFYLKILFERLRLHFHCGQTAQIGIICLCEAPHHVNQPHSRFQVADRVGIPVHIICKEVTVQREYAGHHL